VFKITSFLSTDFSMEHPNDMFRIVHSAGDRDAWFGKGVTAAGTSFTAINTKGGA
jgi:hypothetical protein